jgi:GT2 family glycosyltransferase
MDLSIIIVPFKARKELEVTLDAVYNSQTNYSYEVIIIDNASEDGTLELIRDQYMSRPEIAAKTRVVENKNVGFAIGNNQGMKMATGEYILLLNPDTKVDPDNFQIMLDFMKARPDIGMSTCKLLKANGDIDWASRRSEPSLRVSFYRLFGLQKLFPKWFGAYNVLNKNVDEETQVDAIVGAYMLMTRACYEATGGFDENFFMYGEDLDLCKRARDAGFKVWYYPKTVCMHFKGQSSKKTPQRALYAFYDAMWLYYKKHYSAQYYHLMDPVVYIGIWGLYYVKSLQNYFRKEKYVSK